MAYRDHTEITLPYRYPCSLLTTSKLKCALGGSRLGEFNYECFGFRSWGTVFEVHGLDFGIYGLGF